MGAANTLKTIRNATVLVMKKPSYFIMAAVAAFVVLAFSIFIVNVSLIFDSIRPDYGIAEKTLLLARLFGGLVTNNTPTALAMLLITASLAGLNVALLVFKVTISGVLSPKDGGLSTGGAIAGVAASGCAACGIGVLSLVGLTGGVLFLPFGGLELGVLGIVLLLVSLHATSKSIVECKVSLSRRA